MKGCNMTPPAIGQDPILSHVLAYWGRQRGSRAMPARRDIDPTGLGARVLPHVVLVEVVADGARFRFRLCGTAVAEAAGLDLTGRYIDELNPNATYAAYIIGLYRKVLATRRPVYSESAYMEPASRARRSTRRVMCPLSADGITVDRVLAAQTFQEVTALDPPTMTYADVFQPGLEQVL